MPNRFFGYPVLRQILILVGFIAVAWAMLPQGRQAVQAQRGPKPPQGRLQIVDNGGQVIGSLFDFYFVAIPVGNFFIGGQLDVTDFDRTNHPNAAYESTDCTGTPYISAAGPVREAWIGGNILFFPNDPLQLLTINSYRTTANPLDGLTTGCIVDGPLNRLVGPVGTFNVAGFVPPFRVIIQ